MRDTNDDRAEEEGKEEKRQIAEQCISGQESLL